MTDKTPPHGGAKLTHVEAATLNKSYWGNPAALKAASTSKFGLKGDPEKWVPFLRPKQLAAQLGVSTKTLERMRKDGAGPRYIQWKNGPIRYPIVEIDKWVSANLVPPKSSG